MAWMSFGPLPVSAERGLLAPPSSVLSRSCVLVDVSFEPSRWFPPEPSATVVVVVGPAS